MVTIDSSQHNDAGHNTIATLVSCFEGPTTAVEDTQCVLISAQIFIPVLRVTSQREGLGAGVAVSYQLSKLISHLTQICLIKFRITT